MSEIRIYVTDLTVGTDKEMHYATAYQMPCACCPCHAVLTKV